MGLVMAMDEKSSIREMQGPQALPTDPTDRQERIETAQFPLGHGGLAAGCPGLLVVACSRESHQLAIRGYSREVVSSSH
jgi:hypothetical protein